MSIYRKGRKRPKEVGVKIADKLSRKIVQYDLNDNFIKDWKSGSYAARELGYSQALINACCLGKRNLHKGFKWKYKNNEK